jgi:hypothetical protein
VEKELIDFGDVFKIGNDRIEINPELNDYDARSQVTGNRESAGNFREPLMSPFN